MPKYHISGTVYYADGFDITVEAANEDEARKEAESCVLEEDGYKFNPELQEICVETVTTVVDEDT